MGLLGAMEVLTSRTGLQEIRRCIFGEEGTSRDGGGSA